MSANVGRFSKLSEKHGQIERFQTDESERKAIQTTHYEAQLAIFLFFLYPAEATHWIELRTDRDPKVTIIEVNNNRYNQCFSHRTMLSNERVDPRHKDEDYKSVFLFMKSHIPLLNSL